MPAQLDTRNVVRRERLLAGLARARASVVFLIAAAGYGKTTLVRQYAATFDRAAFCECSGVLTETDLARRVVDALIEEEPARANPLAGLRVSRTVLDELDDVWAKPTPQSLFVFDNVDSLDASVAAQRLLWRLLTHRPDGRVLAVCSREPLRARTSRFAPPHEIAVVRGDDLAFDRQEFAALFAGLGVGVEELDAAYRLANGWPVATLLLVRFAREARLQELLGRLHDVAFSELYDYLAEQVLDDMSELARGALIIAACLDGATARDIRDALCAEGLSEREVEALLVDLPFVRRAADGTYAVHSLMQRLIDIRYEGQRIPFTAELARRFEHAGLPLQAAQIHARRGDSLEAARLLHMAAKAKRARPSGAGVPSAAFAQVLSTLDMEAFTRYPDLWCIAAQERRTREDRRVLAREAEELRRRVGDGEESADTKAMLAAFITGDLSNAGREEATPAPRDDGRLSVSLSPAEREFSVLSGTLQIGTELIRLNEREYDLLLVLGRSPRGIPRDRVVANVWPDEPGGRGRKALNSALRRLRQRLGNDVVSYDEDVYRLAPDVQVDTHLLDDAWRRLRNLPRLSAADREQLQDMVRRLRAYREAGPRAPEWFESHCRQLGELAEEMAVRLARDRLSAGDAAEAAVIAREIIAFDDLDETAWDLLIRALLAENDRMAAQREFRRYRTLLGTQLGVEPSPELAAAFGSEAAQAAI